MTAPQHPAHLPLGRFAEAYGISHHHAWRLIRSGELPAIRYGQRWLVPVEEGEEALRRRGERWTAARLDGEQ